MASKRLRDIDSELSHYERSVKRRRIMPATIQAVLAHREVRKENVSDNFAPCAINSEDVKARIKYHVKRCHKINHSTQERKQPNETPTISVTELEKMCERAMKDREVEVRREYDNALSCRLMELYESFLKFNSDMMTTGPWTEISSYVS